MGEDSVTLGIQLTTSFLRVVRKTHVAYGALRKASDTK